MNLNRANEVASHIYAFGIGRAVIFPANIEIRELVEFLRSVVPAEKFDHSIVSTVQMETIRFDTSFASRIRTQIDLANEVIESDPKLKQRFLCEDVTRQPSEPHESETYIVLSTLGFGLILVASLWKIGGLLQWLALPAAISIPFFLVFAMRKRTKGMSPDIDLSDYSNYSASEASTSGD